MTMGPLLISMLGYFMVSIMFLIVFKVYLFNMHDLNKSRRFLIEAVEDMMGIDKGQKWKQSFLGISTNTIDIGETKKGPRGCPWHP